MHATNSMHFRGIQRMVWLHCSFVVLSGINLPSDTICRVISSNLTSCRVIHLMQNKSLSRLHRNSKLKDARKSFRNKIRELKSIIDDHQKKINDETILQFERLTSILATL